MRDIEESFQFVRCVAFCGCTRVVSCLGSKSHCRTERLSRLPKPKQKVVMEMLDGVLSQANRQRPPTPLSTKPAPQHGTWVGHSQLFTSHHVF